MSSTQILLVKSGGEASLPEWRSAFAELCPDLDVHWWDDPTVSPSDVVYVLVWQPERGRIATFPNLQVIFSSPAGVDHILADPNLPHHLPIVRSASAETLQTVGEYVCLGVLALQRDLKRALNAQRDHRWDEFQGTRTAPQTRVGVMGLGNIGRLALRMLHGLGYTLAGWSLSPKSLPNVTCYVGLEPPSDSAWDHPRIIVTGHIAGFASRYARAEYVAGAIKAWRRAEPLPNVYQSTRGY